MLDRTEAPRTVDVAAMIDLAPLGRLQIGSFLLCGFVAMLDGLDAQAIAFVAPVIAEAWQVAPVQLGRSSRPA